MQLETKGSSMEWEGVKQCVGKETENVEALKLMFESMTFWYRWGFLPEGGNDSQDHRIH